MEIGSFEWQQLIIEGAGQMDIRISRDHTAGFALHALELGRWNLKMNLTAINNPLDVAVKHYLDSIIPSVFIKAGDSLLDIGSGGGFPGIPLKIIMPSLALTMMDATRKKVSFLNHVIRTLQLKNICALHARLEDLIKDENNHQAFDVITCRAFSSLRHFVRESLPLLKPDGMLIALKGREAEDELKQMGLMDDGILWLELGEKKGSRVSLRVEMSKWNLPFLNENRLLIILRYEETPWREN
jgi:16S rRNA (guanine527-N7)-methyltransferase